MIKEYLNEEVKPAMGCTEPAAVALAVASATKYLKGNINFVEVIVSKSIYKNGLYVSIPGTNGLKGNKIAAALGAFIKPEILDLNLLYYSKKQDKIAAEKLILEKKIQIISNDITGVYVNAIVIDDLGNKAECLILNSHSNIQKIFLNSEIVYESKKDKQTDKNFFVKYNLQNITLEDIINISSELDKKDEEFLFYGVELNMNAANYCLNQKDEFVSFTGKVLSEILSDNIISEKIRKYSSAASFTRMAGSDVTVMSSGGSGNQGIVATIPVFIFGKYNNNSDNEIAIALATSHFLSGFIKYVVGKLAPICGAFYSAGSGATAGISFLMNKDVRKMLNSVNTMISNTTGVICDGAKESCAFRIGVSSQEAYVSSLMADKGLYVDKNQGFIGDCCTDSIKNIQKINTSGMKNLDNLIISLLEGRE